MAILGKILFKRKVIPMSYNALRYLSDRKPRAKLFIDGKMIESETDRWSDIRNPATNEVIGQVPHSTVDEISSAVASAKTAFKDWSRTSVLLRQECLFNLRMLLKENVDKIANIITEEEGKTVLGAKNEVFRGIQAVDFCCSAPAFMIGQTISGLARGLDTTAYCVPLGVTASITPFNYPVMVPLWIFPASLACGNTMVIKPSRRNPGPVMLLMEMAHEAGFPAGTVNVIHGGKDVVNFICDHPDIKSVSFVGSTHTGHQVYQRSVASGKRVQANLGAKNHAVIMPDADKHSALNKLLSGAFSDAGQKCMSTSVAVFVGESKKWVPELVKKAKQLNNNAGSPWGIDIGPLNTSEAKQRVCRLIQSALEEGADILLDGRGITVPGYREGYFVGPTIIQNIKTHMECYQEEIFGPVLLILSTDSLTDALQLINENPFGNATSIYTKDPEAARTFTSEVDVGMLGSRAFPYIMGAGRLEEIPVVGVNVSIPVPVPMFAFSGGKGSFLGDINFSGKQTFNFFTRTKTVIQKW